ncbi:von Willebrand factor type A domain-containing protein [Verrucomicrobiaceae bacterium N1E253]|uniref:von Willebrand factor type A domain-containing protein n=1 Tax=Oceaniferula marina TaxID=2748318 RepID=A0A851GN54_9BACT|nr:von Willebrand factor type A domain-containing protein [Oceaniferula marina]NWK57261.1 von Willebrand factor type A domain-containing protein [Oceaniferula marina]
MNIDINDPRITAFALGELKGTDAVEMARAVQRDPRIRAAVDEVRETSFLLLDSLGGGEVEMLTSAQRQAVRSAGSNPVIEDIASAHMPWWKHPWVTGAGVAAALALGVFFVMEPAGKPQSSEVAEQEVGPDWTQWETLKLMAPVIPRGSGKVSERTPEQEALAWAMTEENGRYREVLARSIRQADWEMAAEVPESREQTWQPVVAGQGLMVPMNAGASSWTWLSRYLNERNALPPKATIRIEELVNHFSYKSPKMLQGARLHADLEMCQTPWNEHSVLLAVHVAAASGADTTACVAELHLDPSRVSRSRLMGYGEPVTATESGEEAGLSPDVSYSRGNYVFYELELAGESTDDGPMVTLRVGSGDSGALSVSPQAIRAWPQASADMRFASMLAAAGRLAQGEGDPSGLSELLDVIEREDGPSMNTERKEALLTLRKLARVLSE